MKVAFVLFGQPRDYITGHKNIMDFCKNQKNVSFDFFYHCWTLNNNDKFQTSPRKIDEKVLYFNENICKDLEELYNPVSHEYENQSNFKIYHESIYKNTISFNNTPDNMRNNMYNIFSQLYTRNKARNLLNTYIKNTNINYDLVIFTRFDIGILPNLIITELNNSKIYVSNMLCPRKLIPDAFMIIPTKLFLEWFNIYEELKDILDNNTLFEYFNSVNESLIINAEQLIFAKYILHYKNTNNIDYYEFGGNIILY